jgi:PadR family transcriptional regulator AphA
MNLSDLCLGALSLGEASGYDIKKLFEASFNHFHSAGFGSIYPALNRLAAEGLVELRAEPGEGRRPERKVYRITTAGQAAFEASLLATEPDEQVRSDFIATLFFAHLLPSDRLEQVLDGMAERYRDKLDYLQQVSTQAGLSAGMRTGIELGIASTRARLDTLEQQRTYLLDHHREPPQCDI